MTLAFVSRGESSPRSGASVWRGLRFWFELMTEFEKMVSRPSEWDFLLPVGLSMGFRRREVVSNTGVREPGNEQKHRRSR
jgi:hypothetical protein